MVLPHTACVICWASDISDLRSLVSFYEWFHARSSYMTNNKRWNKGKADFKKVFFPYYATLEFRRKKGATSEKRTTSEERTKLRSQSVLSSDVLLYLCNKLYSWHKLYLSSPPWCIHVLTTKKVSVPRLIVFMPLSQISACTCIYF